jgi:hypothetical protein
MKNKIKGCIQSISSFFIGFILLTTLGIQCTTKLETWELVKNGKSNYKIYLSDNAIPSEKHAATELQKYIYEISDCKIPITNKYHKTKKFIFVGFNDVSNNLVQNIELDTLGDEEFIIETADNNILIAGGNPRGTLYGVTAFLSDYLGCRWYTTDFKIIPKNKDIIVGPIKIREQPAFEYREAWYKEAYNSEWAVHNRLNPSISIPPDSIGGGYQIYPFVHTFYRLVAPETYFKKYPEYFALVDGKRKGHEAQLCLTNPEVLRIATETVYKWIEEQPNVQVLSVDQNDGYGFCECDKCKAIDEAEGSHSGTIINFVNQIADKVAQTNPKIRIQTLAYVYSEIPPKNIKPRPNVTIRLCHYEYCSAHSLEGCDSHKVFLERLKGWSEIANRITIWDYYTDFDHYLMPYPNFETFKHDIKFYADHNCIGLFAQGSNVAKNGGGEFASLRAWVFAQLMWNPYQDSQALIDEFVTNVYGKSAPFIKAYIELLHAKVKPESVSFSIWARPLDVEYLSPEVVEESVELFRQARASATNDAELLKRVELAELPILYTQLYFYTVGGKAYLTQKEMPKVLQKFQRITEENEITQLAENPKRGSVVKFIKNIKEQYTYLTDWWIIGPFDNPDEIGLNLRYPPENEFDIGKSYLAKNNKSISWKYIENKESGYIDFIKFFGDPNDGVAYAKTTIQLKQAGKIKIGLGSNDGVKLWINGVLVHTNKTARKAVPNQDIVKVNMRKGNNNILIKVDQTGGGWGFYFTFIEGSEFID